MLNENSESNQEKTRSKVLELLRKNIRPEFLNRVDELIMFTPLTRKEIKQIVGLHFEQITKNLAQNGVEISFTDKAAQWIANEGFVPQYGARPIKRALQKNVLNELSKKIIGDVINREKPIIVDAKNDGLVFRN